MGGGGPQGPMTLEQKKKLLWGKKPDPEEPAPSSSLRRQQMGHRRGSATLGTRISSSSSW